MRPVRESEVLARFGYALGEPTRARALLALREAPTFSSDLADLVGTSRQSMSNHLACLRDCGLVVAVPHGRRQRYELADPRLAHALTDLLGLILVVAPGHEPHRESGRDPDRLTSGASTANSTTGDPITRDSTARDSTNAFQQETNSNAFLPR